MSRLLPDRYPALCRQLTELLGTYGIPVRFLEGTKNIWTRDYCPIQVAANRFVKFRYFSVYLRGEHVWLVTDALTTICPANRRPGELPTVRHLLVDVGNEVATRSTAIVTDKVYRENTGQPRERLRRDFREPDEVDRLSL